MLMFILGVVRFGFFRADTHTDSQIPIIEKCWILAQWSARADSWSTPSFYYISESIAYILWNTLLPWTPSAQALLVRCPPALHHWPSGPAPVCWSPMQSNDISDSQTCAGRTRPPAGPATETGALHSDTHRGGETMKQWDQDTGDTDIIMWNRCR